MILAIPIWQGRVSPVFDVAQRAVLADGKDGDQLREEFDLGSHDPALRARTIAALGVGAVICGAISQPYRLALSNAGVRVINGICGEVERVIEAHRSGLLSQTELLMPGCRHRHRHRHRGGRGGRGHGRGHGVDDRT